jgi:hypothetical protein
MMVYRKTLAFCIGLSLAACSSNNTTPPPGNPLPNERPEGQSTFDTPTNGSPAARGAAGGTDSAGGTPTAAANAPNAAANAPAPDRAIEESDIYKLVGSNLFVMNRYRGLQIIDISDLDHPNMIGRAPIFGWPREMYVRGDNAYVIVSDYYDFWRNDTAGALVPYAYYGSQVRIINIADPRNPRVVGGINLDGECTDSRIVGDVMYLVSQRYAWYNRYDTANNIDESVVISVNIADPANVHVVDHKEFPRQGWEDHINVTESAIYLASSAYVGQVDALSDGYQTRIQYIDITDPAGAIRLRGQATVQGRVQDRWSLDEYQGVLRVASGASWGNGNVYLTTLSVQNPDQISPLGQYTLQVSERLTAALFDGPRGYLVTFRSIDPLFLFDLSDPAHPSLRGELQASGWLDYLVPVAEGRIAALGHEVSTGANGAQTISLAVSLIDVSLAQAPQLLSRVGVSGAWGSIPADRDDFAKVFRVLTDMNLIMFPLQAWDPSTYQYRGGVQLVDLGQNNLTKRGFIGNAGWVERAIPDGTTNVITLSSEVYQAMDITDRDNPRLRGHLELARNVQDFHTLPGGYAVQLSGDWSLGDTAVTVTYEADPDSPLPVSRLRVPAPYGRMFVNGNMAYVASIQNSVDANGATIQATRIQVVDLSDPTNPRLRGSVFLPEQVWIGYQYWYWGSGDEVVQVGSTLAFHRYQQYWALAGGDCLDCGVTPARGGGGSPNDNTQKIYLVDLSDPDAPRLASTVTLPDDNWAWGLKASGTTLYLSEYQWLQRDTQYFERYFLRRIEIADPANPVVHAGVNIPGMFIDASASGPYIYTLENWWDQAAQQMRTTLNALALLDDRAYLRGSLSLDGNINNLVIRDGIAYLTTNWYETIAAPMGGQQYVNHSTLQTVDLSNPRALRLAGRADVPYDYAYLQKVENGRAFIGSGAGIFSYRVCDPASPSFESFYRTQGWSQDILVNGLHAYVPSGYYGVQVLNLASAACP